MGKRKRRAAPAGEVEYRTGVQGKNFAKKSKVGGIPAGLFSNKDSGRLVWGKILGSRTWPGIIVPHDDCGMKAPSEDRVWVFWFGDNRVSEIPLSKVFSFKENFKVVYSQTSNPTFEAGVIDCIKELQHQSGFTHGESREKLMEWAYKGFPNAPDYKKPSDTPFSSRIGSVLNSIKKVQLGENSDNLSSDFFPISSSSSSTDSDSSDAVERRNWKPKAAQLKSVRNGKCDIEGLCIACHRTDCRIVAPHPYFTGGLCEHCEGEVEENILDLEAGKSMYCVVCGSPGKLLLCDSPQCERVYCTGCVELLVAPSAVSCIEKTNPWYCFLCEPFSIHTHGLLRPRPQWKEKIARKVNTLSMTKFEAEETPDASTFPKRPLKVLSVFEGTDTGLQVLDKLGLEVEVYYCSEVDETVKKVVGLNSESRVTFINKMQSLTAKQVQDMCPIDLLIGGSSCSDISPSDLSEMGFRFFHFFRIFQEIHSFNMDTHLFWLYENDKKIPNVLKAQISIFLETQPFVIDAKDFSSQSSQHYFWGNISGMYRPVPQEIEYQQLSRDVEKVFGLPSDATETGTLSIKERHSLLERAWSVKTLQYIFEPLCDYYPCRKDGSGNQGDEGSSVNSE